MDLFKAHALLWQTLKILEVWKWNKNKLILLIDRILYFFWRIKRCLYQQIKDYIEVSQFHQHFSPAFFHTKVSRAAFLYLHVMLALFWQKNASTKAALKILVKLTHELPFLFLALFLLQNWPLYKTIKSDYNKATNCLVNVFKVRSFKSKKYQVCSFNPFYTNMWRIKLTWKFPALALRLYTRNSHEKNIFHLVYF